MKKDIGFWNEQGEYIEDIQEIGEIEMEREIIIDGVNVAGCGYFCEADKECSICGMGTDGEDTFCRDCKDNSNCYYKQLQQLKAENERLSTTLTEIKEIARKYDAEVGDIIIANPIQDLYDIYIKISEVME